MSARKHLAQFWTAYLVLVIALLATGSVFAWAQHVILRDQQVRFDQAAGKFRHTIELYFSAYLNILNGLTGFYAHDKLPTAQEFRIFLEAQGLRSTHFGVFDVGYIGRVQPEDRAAILEQARQQGVPAEALPRFHEGPEEDYLLLHWDNFKPTTTPHLALHLFREPDRLEAMHRARDLGEVACTARLTVYTGNGEVAPNGFILYAPIYRTGLTPTSEAARRAELKGFTSMSFFVPECWGNVYRLAGEPGIDFEVYDGRHMRPETLWFDSDQTVRGAEGAAVASPPRYAHSQAVGGLGREWTFYCASLPTFEAASGIRISWLILVSGLGVSMALFLLSCTQTRNRLRAERLARELRESGEHIAAERERLAVTLSSIGDGVIAIDRQGLLVLMNRAAESQTGWPQTAACGRPLAEVLQLEDPSTHTPLPCPVADVLDSGQPWQSRNPSLLRGRERPGPTVLIQVSPMRDTLGGVAGAVLVLQDVTERQHLLQERLRSSRLESVGVLAGGIAHDFNNILTAIVGNVSLAVLDAPDQGDQRTALREAELACHRARELTQQLLTFAKGGTPIRTTARLDSVIRESARFATHGSTARCEGQLPDDLWPVEADKGQISQVIQNIVINAAQAMPEGGVIRIGARNVTLATGNTLDLREGRYVKLTIEDQGTGIRPEHLDKIFDPYFSTKQRGSGLGLATSYSIVKQHDGSIEVESTLGVGSRFHVYLPASDRPAPASPSPADPPPSSCRGRILVMDDEESVLNLLSRMLEKLGYEVLTARDGAEAVRVLAGDRAEGRVMDAAILDLTVPGAMGGEQALKQLRALDPNLKALVSSGYSSAPVMANFREFGFQAVVPKPYGVETLAAALAEVLSPGPSTPLA